MATTNWTWAKLSDEQLRKVSEAEKSLGAEYLLAFQPTSHSSRAVEARTRNLHTAPLTESQLECLHGLEQQLDAVIVAYTNTQ